MRVFLGYLLVLSSLPNVRVPFSQTCCSRSLLLPPREHTLLQLMPTPSADLHLLVWVATSPLMAVPACTQEGPLPPLPLGHLLGPQFCTCPSRSSAAGGEHTPHTQKPQESVDATQAGHGARTSLSPPPHVHHQSPPPWTPNSGEASTGHEE